MGEVIDVNQARPAPDVVARASRVLAEDGVLVMPTDSVYGIGVAATPSNPGLGRVFSIKRRDRSQTLPWLVAGTGDLDRCGVDVPDWAHDLASAFWPGALTLVVHASDVVPPEYRRDDGTIALRLPDSPLVHELARAVGVPLAVTSANTHGAPSPVSGADLERRIVTESDLTLDGGPAPEGVASTIVVCTGTEPIVVREGAIPSASIMEVLG
ncbi:MAG: threonylcarbamoyl-AMP synthase [Atopobiaceae bacterium]|jgi:tRNA threonylcarbamoyl adenosine modification protein (Sua5/YciO/YrdC/YwlC family)|nr:threonylcarbamoyl-AMP synthase [Atopobiaceae bacterium]MCI2173566.1 threonylcarbamoyl-AMP synthase [Atopobiaceae bacterium]MCI2207792.1 threonylcarbamoyl-AMP synthase [Atopobiaceae bacterium]